MIRASSSASVLRSRRSDDRSSCWAAVDSGQLGAEAGELAPGEVDARARCSSPCTWPWRRAASAWRSSGSQLATDLAEQVLDAGEVGLGRREAPLGLLLATPELQHAGGFLDDQPAVLRPWR